MQQAPRDPWQSPEDDLFRPTVAASVRDPSLPKPWRIGSQLWVAFFGGCFAVLAVAWINAHRLGMDWREVGVRMVGATAVAWALVTAALVGFIGFAGYDVEYNRYFRWAYRGAALLLHLYFARIQEAAHRRYLLTTNADDHASLWGPGVIAIFGGAVVQTLLTIVVLVPVLILFEEEL